LKLTNFEIHFDEETGRILVLKPTREEGRAAVIEIKTNDPEQIQEAIRTGKQVIFTAEILLEVNKHEN
jgi:hypothetical protein